MSAYRGRRIVEIDESGFRELVSSCQVIEKDHLGDKVFLSNDDRIIKVFRLKRLLSSALLVPYALRFAGNAARLHRLGIRTVEVHSIYRLRARRQHVVIYPRLPGETLRATLAAAATDPSLLDAFARYLAQLHDKGVYFRSLHFGNVIVDAGGAFALIDVTDMRFTARPLPSWKRTRNFRHLLRYAEDREALIRFGESRFVASYLDATRLVPAAAQTLSKRIAAAIKRRTS